MTGHTQREYSAISPSAKSLVQVKAKTDIPFAKKVASVLLQESSEANEATDLDPAFWKRVVHFEIRYWSIDQLLSDLPIQNVLELSSGYSFRGLDMVRRKKVHYIDTDLPGIIDSKKGLLK